MAIPTVTPAEAMVRLRDAPDETVLLDVRQPEELALARVPGALEIPMREIPARLPEIPRASEVLVVCHVGFRSAKVAAFLLQQGYPRVASVAGGVDAWPGLPRY